MTTLSSPQHRHLRQIQGVQIWRAVAVLLVTAGHVNQVTVPISAITANQVRFGNLGMFGVDIFFVISGFILGSTAMRAASGAPNIEAYDFIARRILRIFPIYWVVILFPLFRALLLHRLTLFNFLDYWLLLPGLSYPETQLIVGIAWTLIFEMVFYYVMAIFMRFTLRRAVPNTMAALIVFVLIGLAIGIRHPVVIILMNPILLEFVLGSLTALAFRRLGKRRTPGILLLLAGIVLTAVISAHVTHNVAIEQNVLHGDYVLLRVASWGIAAWALVSGMIFWGPQVTSLPGKIFVVIGDGSYSIYLTSAVSIEMVARALAKVPKQIVTDRLVFLRSGLAFACVILIGMTFYATVEKPLSKYLGSAYRSMFRRRLSRLASQVIGA